MKLTFFSSGTWTLSTDSKLIVFGMEQKINSLKKKILLLDHFCMDNLNQDSKFLFQYAGCIRVEVILTTVLLSFA